MCLEQNRMFVDRRDEAGGEYRNLYFYADVVNECQLTKFLYCLLLNMIFFSLPLHSLLFHSFFHGFSC